jgi:hypothetical protein
MRRAATLLLIGVLPWLTFAVQAAEGVPKPAIKIATEGKCIAPTEEMRRNHMDMLKHTRDKTMRQGIRGEKASLNECIGCHASKSTGSVLGKDHFCESCHAYAAVKLDCWDCHQPKAGYKATGVKP